jgi:hypothetical protein
MVHILGENKILSWDQMKDTFLQKYQDYCKDNAKNDIFKMQQTKDESPEDYLERFLYNYQKSKLFTTDPTVVRTVFLKGIRDDCIEVLNLLSSGDVHQNFLQRLEITVEDTQEDKLKHANHQEILLAEIQDKAQELSPELS